MNEFQKNLQEYSQHWFRVKGLARDMELHDDGIMKQRLEQLSLVAGLWQDCLLLRMREAGL